MRIALFALLILSTPARSEPWIDDALLMQQHADDVVTRTDANGRLVRTLSLAEGLTVTCTDDGCHGMDMQDQTGCLMLILHELRNISQACPRQISGDQQGRLDRVYNHIGTFVAANAVPVTDWSSLRALMDAGMPAAAMTDAECAEFAGPQSGVIRMMQALTDSAALAQLENHVPTPRLPVANPCL